MTMKTAAAIGAIIGLVSVSGASARTGADEPTTKHRVAQKHHVARYRNPAVQTDVPQEQAAPEAAKPAESPETFYHASGSDGSHYGE